MADSPAERRPGDTEEPAFKGPPVTAQEEADAAHQLVATLEKQLRRIPKNRVLDRATVRYRLGLAYQELPTGNRDINLGRAVANLREAVRLFDPSSRPIEHARAQNALGAALRQMRQLEEAAEAFLRASELIPREINPGEYGAAQNNLGLVYTDLGRRDGAEEAYKQALKAFSGHEHVPWRIVVLHNLGQLLADSGDPERLEEGLDLYAEALELTDPEENSYQWGLIHHSMGVAYTSIGQPAKAVEALKQALRVFTRQRFPFQYALTKNNIGLAYAQLGDPSSLRRAVASFEDALRMLDMRLHREQWEQAYRNMELAENALEDKGLKRTWGQNFVLMAAEEEGDDLLALMRERLMEYVFFPEPRRTEVLAELDHSMLSLDFDDARRLTGAWMQILMELPHEHFLAALKARILVLQRLEGEASEKAHEILDQVIQEEVLAPQRIRVRDTLYDLGYKRPGQAED